MRRITTWALSTISALVLLFSYHTSTNAAAGTAVVAQGNPGTASGSTGSGSTGSGSTGSGSTDSGSSGSGPTGSGSTDSGSSGSGSTDSGSASAGGAYTGDAVTTRYGDVQVRITVENGRITAAEVTQVPWSNPKDQEINSYAVPILNKEAVKAQSADIDMVSGATYTSEGYLQSLQSAIDQANL